LLVWFECRGGHLLVPLLNEEVDDGLLARGRVDLGDGSEGAVGSVEEDFVDGFDGRRCRFGQIERGDLEGVEEEPGAFGVEAAAGDALGDEGDGGLDGGTVFELGKLEVGVGVGERVARFGGAGGVVVVAEVLMTQTFATAAMAVGKDVTALEVSGLWFD
jgi:hypothetical protein